MTDVIWNEERVQIALKEGDMDTLFFNVNNLANYLGNTKQFIGNWGMDDLKQTAIERVLKKYHLYNISKGRSYSYFYKVVYMSFIYDIRERTRRAEQSWKYNALFIDTELIYHCDPEPDAFKDKLDEIERDIPLPLEKEWDILRRGLERGEIIKRDTLKVRKYIKERK